MKEIKFKKMVETMQPRKIIAQYIHNKINLTSKQLQEVIRLKNEEGKEHE